MIIFLYIFVMRDVLFVNVKETNWLPFCYDIQSEMEDQENEAGGDTSEVEVVEFTGDDINLNDAYESVLNYFNLQIILMLTYLTHCY